MTWSEVALHAVAGPYSHLWPLVVLPGLAALLSEWAARELPPTRADWRIGALLAALPGLVMMAVGIGTLAHCLAVPAAPGWEGTVACRIPPVLVMLVFGRALILAALRQSALRRVLRFAVPAGPRLAAAAEAAGVRAFEIPLHKCECFVAGVWRPAAYVSSGTMARVSDAELRAMLHHEREHAAGRDSAILTILSFLHDLVPLGRRALDAFCEARERSADRRAVRAEGPIPLASALVAVAKSQTAAPALGMGGASTGAWRLDAILGTEEAPTARAGPGPSFGTALLIAVLSAAWPLLQGPLAQMLCPGSL